MKYEWDDDKYNLNFEQHGIRFEIAQGVFADENAVEVYDKAHSNLIEKRFNIIGMSFLWFSAREMQKMKKL